MGYFVALLILVLVYVVVKFLLGKVSALAELAEILALVCGVLAALAYLGAV